MTPMGIMGVRGVDLGVRDLELSARFYSQHWGLEPVATTPDTIYLRGTGSEHHVLALRRRPRSEFLGARFAVPDKASVDGLYERARGFGATLISAPSALPEIEGGGYGFTFATPDGIPLTIVADVATHADAIDDASRPSRFSHVVFRTSTCDDHEKFFVDLMGFKVSDRSDNIHFLRCAKDHHAVALAKVEGPGIHHFAFEMDSIDSLMRACGRLQMAGNPVEWGIGRHAGPGNNVFSVFVEPDGFAAELTTEMEQCADDRQTGTPEYWRSRPLRPCAWGIAMKPTKRAQFAQSGKLLNTPEARACEDQISESRAAQ